MILVRGGALDGVGGIAVLTALMDVKTRAVVVRVVVTHHALVVVQELVRAVPLAQEVAVVLV